MVSERSRREVKKHGQTKAAGALARLAELRGGKKQTFDIREEEDVYDTMDEDEYAQHVSKRREEGGDFVDEDGVEGYRDLGEDDWGAEGSDEDEPAKRSKTGGSKGKQGDAKGAKGTKRKAEGAPGKHRLERMFAKHTGPTRMAPALKSDSHTGQASDALLDDILGELGGGTTASGPPPRQQLGGRATPVLIPSPLKPQPPPAARAAVKGNPFRRESKGAPPRRIPDLDDDPMPVDPPQEPASAQKATVEEFGGEYFDDDDDLMEAGELKDVKEEPNPQAGAAALTPPAADGGHASSTPKPKSDLVRRLQTDEGVFAEGKDGFAEGKTPIGPPGQRVKQEGTPWRTPAPVFSEPQTPVTAVAATGWQELCGEQVDGDEEMAEEAEWKDDGSLPLNKEGGLPFYFLDAHEEANAPHTVYLFGKVPHEGSFLSCCLTVKNCQKALFFVPKEGEIGDLDGQLAQMEEDAAADPAKKGELLKCVHALAAKLKAEMRATLTQHGITKFVIKPVKRNYAFELATIPRREQWVLKVKFAATASRLPLGLTGERFAAVLGVEQSPLEAILLKRRIRGPSWITVAKPTRIQPSAQVSWCKLEVEAGSAKNISSALAQSRQDVPPIIVAAISLKTAINAQTNSSEVVAASVVYLNKVRMDRGMAQTEWNTPQALRHFSTVRKLDGRPFPPGFEENVKRANESPMGRKNGGCLISAQGSERALLAFLLAKLHEVDADVYAGHNISGFDIDVLLHRLQHHKVAHWSRIGRLKRTKFPNLGGGGHAYGGGAGPGVMSALAGRLLCDTYLAARDLVKEVDYTLKTLSRSLLNQERHELTAADVPAKFDTSGKLMELVQHAESDAWLSLGLSFYLNVLPLTRLLSELSGSMWSKALQGQRAQRIEMLLLHEFYQRKFLLPDKLKAKDRERLTKAAAKARQLAMEGDDGEEAQEEKPDVKKNGKGPQYAGGLVLEPKKGLYDKFVLLLDFNSLYPSIIQEYNICFTTVAAVPEGQHASVPQPSSDLAPLPKVIQGLVQRRRQVKAALKGERDPTRRAQMDIRQQALKLTANSMYGCLGFTHSRFYARPLAELVTGQGREILQSTVDLVQGTVGAEVIYGDTDSIMVNTGSTDIEEVKQLGEKVKKEVNKRYKLLEIELDGVFKCMLLLKKKKYAAIKLDATQDGSLREVVEQKGLDIVRRDWCPLSKDVGNYALEQILSGRPREDVVNAVHAKLMEVREKMGQGQVSLNKFIITKQLTKRPEEYPDAQNQPHVQVALRRSKQNKRDGVAQGETVPYIICVPRNEDGSAEEGGSGLAERAYHPEEVNGNPRLTVDVNYYLSNQVHPVVSRLCGPIEGTDSARLADCLGLDPSKFRGPPTGASAEEVREEALLASAASLDDDALYKDCRPLMLWGADGEAFPFRGIEGVAKGTVEPNSLLVSPHHIGETGLTPAQLANQARVNMRNEAAAFYDFTLHSDDEMNPLCTRNVCLRTAEGEGRHIAGSLVPDSTSTTHHMWQEYTQQGLYRQLFHFRRQLDVQRALSKIQDQAQRDQAATRLGSLRAALEGAAATVLQTLQADGYHWVDLQKLCKVDTGVLGMRKAQAGMQALKT